MQKKLKVSSAAGRDAHELKINVPSFDEATDAQKRSLYDLGIKKAIIETQDGMRREAEKDERKLVSMLGEVQSRFDAVIAGQNFKRTIDAGALLAGFDFKNEVQRKIARTQLDLLISLGNELRNVPKELASK